MNKKQLLGLRIKELRKAKNITQEQLAEMADVEPASISNIECGRNYPNLSNLEKILSILNSNFTDVFNFEHLKTKSDVKNKILKYIENADNKKLEFLYKILMALNEYNV